MISTATLHEIVGILHTEAEVLEVAAHHAVEAHNALYVQAKIARAQRLREYADEINAHLLTLPPAS